MRIQLSAAFVRSAVCPHSAKKIDYFDLNQRGFQLEVRRSGGKTYYQRYTDNRGRERQFKIGPADVLPLSAARRLAQKVQAQALIGEDPHDHRSALRNTPTLNELVRDRYLIHIKSYKRSWRTDETFLRIHIIPALGSKYIDQISGDEIAALVARMRDKQYASGTTNRVVIVLRHIFNLARKWRIPGAKENPTAGIALAPDVSRERFLSLEEARRLVASIEEDENQIAAQAIMLLLLTGARRNEITHAKWEHVDWKQKCLLVPLSKSGKPRTIALNGPALALLQKLAPQQNCAFIFASPLTGRPSPSLYFPWQRIRVRAGLSDLRLHDLRHSFASFLVNSGVSLYVVQGLLGHGNARYTQRYAHLAPDTLREAAETVGSVIVKARASRDQDIAATL